MRGIPAVLSVNVARVKGRPWYVLMTSGLMLAAIVVAVFISSKIDGRATVAFVPTSVSMDDSGSLDSVFEERAGASHSSLTGGPGAFDSALDRVEAVLQRFFRVERVHDVPPLSQLMRNRFDAIVIEEGDGRYDIVTIKSDDFRAQIRAVLSEPESVPTGGGMHRGIGTTIVGYLVMFVLISGSTYMNFFTDDKRAGTFRRTVTSPVGVPAYLAGQLLFNGFMLLVPVMVMLAVLKEIFHMDIGFSYVHYGLLMGLLASLATALGFFIAAVIEDPDDGMAVASSVIIVTSLLSGTFFAFDHGDAFMRFVTGILPQRSFMDVAGVLESGSSLGSAIGSVGHVVAMAFILAVTGWVVCERRFRSGSY